MNVMIRNKIEDVIRSIQIDASDPRVLVLGATGVGKSSLINALLGAKVHAVNTVRSTTRSFSTHSFAVPPNVRIEITDSPGYGEVGYDTAYSREVVSQAASHDAVVLVLKADDKAYIRDLQIIGAASHDPAFAIEKSLLIALNQIDKIKPSREWLPPYDLDQAPAPTDAVKVRNIRDKVALVREQFKEVIGERHVVVAPTMCDADEGQMVGIDRLKLELFRLLPAVARFRFAQAAHLAENASASVLAALDEEASVLIAGGAAAAFTAVAANPIPASDFVLLIPIQIAMIVKIGAIYGRTISKETAFEVLTTLAAGLAARTAFQGIISLIPGVKNVIGPPFASAATYGLGVAAKAYFQEGSMPTAAQLSETVTAHLGNAGA